MTRVVLVHWNAAEAEANARELRDAGFDVRIHADSQAHPRELLEPVPEAFVIDLRRTPSHGRELGGWLRRTAATRRIPLVFVEGDPEKTERVRRLLPDAVFTPWEGIAAALDKAVAAPPSAPIVPGGMDAYAQASLAQKLGLRPAARLVLFGAPEGFETSLPPLPEGTVVSRNGGRGDVVLFFTPCYAILSESFAAALRSLLSGGRMWILWPKRSSGVASDLTQAIVRRFGLERGLVDYKIAAIDSTWSGLCFARRGGASAVKG